MVLRVAAGLVLVAILVFAMYGPHPTGQTFNVKPDPVHVCTSP